MRQSCRRYLDLSAGSLTLMRSRDATARNFEVVRGTSPGQGKAVAAPVLTLLRRKSEAVADEERVDAPEIGVERIGIAHRAPETIPKLFARHQQRNDIGAIAIAGSVIVEPARLFQPRVKWRRWYGMQQADKSIADARILDEFEYRIEDRRDRSRRSCGTTPRAHDSGCDARARAACRLWASHFAVSWLRSKTLHLGSRCRRRRSRNWQDPSTALAPRPRRDRAWLRWRVRAYSRAPVASGRCRSRSV